jgi:hypothetical protein
LAGPNNREVDVFEVFHPFEDKMISVQDYLEFAALSGFTFTREAPAARCPVCKGAMRSRGGGTKADEHFFHVADHFCPTKDPSARPYLNKQARNADELVVARNRQFVAQHLALVCAKMFQMVPCLDFAEFITMLKEARRLNIYGYAGFIPEYVPYVLVTLMNFLPATSYQKSRELKFIFFYDARIADYEDLWIDRGFTADLVRISYDKSITKKVRKIDVETDYLLGKPRSMTPKMMKWCLNVM